jgi:hypothetical protein
MFVWNSNSNSIRGKKVNFFTLEDKLQTGDILLFEGNAWYSRLIELFGFSRYSHIGIVLRDPTYINDKFKGLYLLQASIIADNNSVSSSLSHYGVQLVPLRKAINSYILGSGIMYYRSLECTRDDSFQTRLKNAYDVASNKPYDINPCDWIKAEFGMDCGNVQKTNEFWCSSLVAFIYVRLGFLYPTLPWSIITPRNFSGFEEHQLPFQDCNLFEEVEVEFSAPEGRKHLKLELEDK